LKRLFKRRKQSKKKQQHHQIWKPEMVLLCYDHHENVKQIEINSDSGSEDSDSESDENLNHTENENLPEDHKVIVQKGWPMAISSVLRWTQNLSSQRIFGLFAERRRYMYILCAVLVVGIGVFISWLYL
jgi:hypothetical protein